MVLDVQTFENAAEWACQDCKCTDCEKHNKFSWLWRVCPNMVVSQVCAVGSSDLLFYIITFYSQSLASWSLDKMPVVMKRKCSANQLLWEQKFGR